jgi:hypothetical protein
MSSQGASRVARGFGWLGMLGHLAMGVWYAASGLLAPTWAVIVLMAIWVGMTVVAWRLVRSDSPLWTLGIPVIDAAIWLAVISAGDAFLDWTA